MGSTDNAAKPKTPDQPGPFEYVVLAVFRLQDSNPEILSKLQAGATKGLPRVRYDWEWQGGYRGNQTFSSADIPDAWPWTHIGVVTFRSKKEADAWLASESFAFMQKHAELVIRSTVTTYE